jgi:fibrillarin-like rRNA methylase
VNQKKTIKIVIKAKSIDSSTTITIEEFKETIPGLFYNEFEPRTTSQLETIGKQLTVYTQNMPYSIKAFKKIRKY